ncbi:hypothetical protein HK099_001719 [Clydaea vesicula]|uniref:G-protein coupled receptors family 1 profile domain-containing protein n=1 Tax=Clydaea vesicula TaxID=447962 RepID=A0AAD5XUX1_9FUNG|nr:hypothetical protein HK099_001719 [Clydaea vesicula]
MVVRRAGKGLRIGSGGGSSTQNDSSSRSLSKSKTELGVKNQKPDVKKPSRADLETRVLHQGIIIVLSFLTGWTPYLLFMFYEVISKTPTSVGYETFAIAFVGFAVSADCFIVIYFDNRVRNFIFRKNDD